MAGIGKMLFTGLYLCNHFFKLLYGFHTVNFGPTLREQFHSPDVNDFVIQFCNETLVTRLSL